MEILMCTSLFWYRLFTGNYWFSLNLQWIWNREGQTSWYFGIVLIRAGRICKTIPIDIVYETGKNIADGIDCRRCLCRACRPASYGMEFVEHISHKYWRQPYRKAGRRVGKHRPERRRLQAGKYRWRLFWLSRFHGSADHASAAFSKRSERPCRLHTFSGP